MIRKLIVNGDVHEVDVAGDTPLLWVLRDTLGLTGTKYGCGIMACGACTVLIAGTAHDPVQKAWAELSVAQCGYCQSGMIMSVVALLAEHPDPSDAQIATGVTNLCRCGTYQQVRRAIRRAAEEMRNA